MQKCPNCGRPAARTEDWACQWCGYPLISKAFKKIPKTYRQLQEERRESLVTEPVPETEPALEAEPVIESEPELEPEPERESISEAEPIAELEPESIAELEGEPILEDEPKPVSKPETKRKRKRKHASVSKVETEPALEPEDEPVLETETVPEPEQELVAGIEPALDTESETALTGTEVTVEELVSAYKTDSAAADAKFANETIRVTGIVDKMVVRDHLDIRYVLLASAKTKGAVNIRCTFGKERISELRRLTIGQAVIIQGKCDGYQKNILMSDCSVVGW
ncbi:hypothetical protein ACFLUO_05765 [Chloroflexota bacterium]